MRIDIKFDKQSLDWIAKFPDRALTAIEKGFKNALIDAEGQAKGSGYKQSGLKVRTGHLRRSIYSRYKGYLKGELGSPLVYSRIHQYGGVIVPKKKKSLKFQVQGKWVTCKKVTMPERPYIKPKEQRYKKIIENTFLEEMRKYDVNA